MTDPFSRSAYFSYNTIISVSTNEYYGHNKHTFRFAYTTEQTYMSSLSTPYGTTTFTVTEAAPGGIVNDRTIQATDPQGNCEKAEFMGGENDYLPTHDPSYPTGLLPFISYPYNTNELLQYLP